MNSHFFTSLVLGCTLWCGAARDALAEKKSSPAEQAASLVTKVLADPRNPVRFFEDTVLDGRFEEIAAFRELTKLLADTNLSEAWGTLPNDRDSRMVFIYALRDVSGPDYLAFGETAFKALKEHQIDQNLFVLGYLMPSHRKQSLFTSNFTHPGVRDFVSKVRSELHADADIVAWADNVLSGKLAKRDQMLRAENPNTRNEELELLPGPKTDTSKASDQRTKQTALASPAPKKAPDAKPATTTEEAASTPWLVWGMMIVAAIVLLWLLLKNRK
jgi:hypothetical protein